MCTRRTPALNQKPSANTNQFEPVTYQISRLIEPYKSAPLEHGVEHVITRD